MTRQITIPWQRLHSPSTTDVTVLSTWLSMPDYSVSLCGYQCPTTVSLYVAISAWLQCLFTWLSAPDYTASRVAATEFWNATLSNPVTESSIWRRSFLCHWS